MWVLYGKKPITIPTPQMMNFLNLNNFFCPPPSNVSYKVVVVALPITIALDAAFALPLFHKATFLLCIAELTSFILINFNYAFT